MENGEYERESKEVIEEHQKLVLKVEIVES
jgi:hypothetical protein